MISYDSGDLRRWPQGDLTTVPWRHVACHDGDFQDPKLELQKDIPLRRYIYIYTYCVNMYVYMYMYMYLYMVGTSGLGAWNGRWIQQDPVAKVDGNVRATGLGGIIQLRQSSVLNICWTNPQFLGSLRVPSSKFQGWLADRDDPRKDAAWVGGVLWRESI